MTSSIQICIVQPWSCVIKRRVDLAFCYGQLMSAKRIESAAKYIFFDLYREFITVVLEYTVAVQSKNSLKEDSNQEVHHMPIISITNYTDSITNMLGVDKHFFLFILVSRIFLRGTPTPKSECVNLLLSQDLLGLCCLIETRDRIERITLTAVLFN